MEQYEEDIARHPIVVQEGFARVPAAPGIGLEIDDDALSRLAANPDPYTSIARSIGILRLPYGETLYTRSFPDVGNETGMEEGAIRGTDFELWQDDGSEKFAQLYARLEQGGSFLERASD